MVVVVIGEEEGAEEGDAGSKRGDYCDEDATDGAEAGAFWPERVHEKHRTVPDSHRDLVLSISFLHVD